MMMGRIMNANIVSAKTMGTILCLAMVFDGALASSRGRRVVSKAQQYGAQWKDSSLRAIEDANQTGDLVEGVRPRGHSFSYSWAVGKARPRRGSIGVITHETETAQERNDIVGKWKPYNAPAKKSSATTTAGSKSGTKQTESVQRLDNAEKKFEHSYQTPVGGNPMPKELSDPQETEAEPSLPDELSSNGSVTAETAVESTPQQESASSSHNGSAAGSNSGNRSDSEQSDLSDSESVKSESDESSCEYYQRPKSSHSYKKYTWKQFEKDSKTWKLDKERLSKEWTPKDDKDYYQ